MTARTISVLIKMLANTKWSQIPEDKLARIASILEEAPSNV